MYSIFVFHKPDPDVNPPILTPNLQDGNHIQEDVSVLFVLVDDILVVSIPIFSGVFFFSSYFVDSMNGWGVAGGSRPLLQ